MTNILANIPSLVQAEETEKARPRDVDYYNEQIDNLINKPYEWYEEIFPWLKSQEQTRRSAQIQHYENMITRLREDTAQQRSASDLISAGLSKTLSAGSGASSSSGSASDMKSEGSALSDLMSAINIASSVANLDLTKATVHKTTSEAEGQDIANGVAADKAEAEIAEKNAIAAYYDAQTDLANIEGEHMAEKISKDIEEVTSRISKNYTDVSVGSAQREKIIEEIKNEVLKGVKLSKESDMLVLDMIGKALDIDIADYNYQASVKSRLRTTDPLENKSINGNFSFAGLGAGFGFNWRKNLKSKGIELSSLSDLISNKYFGGF